MNMYSLEGWTKTTCVRSDDIRNGMSPWSSLTDLDGNFGPPIVYTEWADPATEQPVLRDYRWPGSSRECEHYVPSEAI